LRLRIQHKYYNKPQINKQANAQSHKMGEECPKKTAGMVNVYAGVNILFISLGLWLKGFYPGDLSANEHQKLVLPVLQDEGGVVKGLMLASFIISCNIQAQISSYLGMLSWKKYHSRFNVYLAAFFAMTVFVLQLTAYIYLGASKNLSALPQAGAAYACGVVGICAAFVTMCAAIQASRVMMKLPCEDCKPADGNCC